MRVFPFVVTGKEQKPASWAEKDNKHKEEKVELDAQTNTNKTVTQKKGKKKNKRKQEKDSLKEQLSGQSKDDPSFGVFLEANEKGAKEQHRAAAVTREVSGTEEEEEKVAQKKNVSENHSARALKCSVRKKTLKDKEPRLRREKDARAFTTCVQAAAPTPTTDLATMNFVVSMSLLNAHLVNVAVPGSFQKTVSESLALNGLEDVKLPPNPPSAKIVKALLGNVQQQQQ